MASSPNGGSQTVPPHHYQNPNRSNSHLPSTRAADNSSRRQGHMQGSQRGGRLRRSSQRLRTSPILHVGRKSDFNEDLAGLTANQQPKPSAKESGIGDESADEVEVEVCFICASAVVHNAVASCDHRTCHICALRLRALYKTKACAHCRAQSDYVIFTDAATKRYDAFAKEDFVRVDDGLGIKYEKPDILEDTILLLRYNCPNSACDVACFGWPDLYRHVKIVHHQVMCDLCTRNKKVFTHEHELFTASELKRHERFGDDHPGAVDQSGFKGHPECGFCKRRFYGDDELYAHCRDQHERCHICDRRHQTRQQQYYVNYDALEAHFRQDHFLCAEQECLEKKFVVFDSEIDLKAHQLEAHPNVLSKDARKEARRIDMSGFDYRPQHHNDRRERRGGERGRDSNAEPVPASSAQPLRRDELAFQRQMAIQSAQSISTRTFGGQLSLSALNPSRSTQNQGSGRNQMMTSLAPPRHEEVNGASSRFDPLGIGRDSHPLPRLSSKGAGENQSPQEQTRRLRHGAVMERALNLLGHDQSKFERFRSLVSSYQNTSTSASELINDFFSLFDTSPSELGKLIKELAEIYETESKRSDLLKAWNDWRAVNEDYPALPRPTGIPMSSSTSTLGSGGTRVLRLKSSTAQSSRSSVSRQESWGSQNMESNSFPPMVSSRTPNTTTTRPLSKKLITTPWIHPSASSSSSSPSRQSSSRPPGSRSATTDTTSTEAFPALPVTAKPVSTILGYGTRVVRRDLGQGNVSHNAWSLAGSSDMALGSHGASGTSDLDPAGKKKGKGNKKQTLFHFG